LDDGLLGERSNYQYVVCLCRVLHTMQLIFVRVIVAIVGWSIAGRHEKQSTHAIFRTEADLVDRAKPG
jgi:hypothetical protein